MTYILEAKNLSYVYPQKTLFKNFDLKVNKGEWVVFIGNNGSGKTTLLKNLAGITPVQSGQVNLSSPTLHQAYVGQLDFSLYDRFPATALEVVMSAYTAPLGFFKYPSPAQKAEAIQLLCDLGLQDSIHQQLGQLSGGQRQRVFIAKALLLKPDLLFLDEPNSALDAHFTHHLFKRLKAYQKEGMTLIMVTHDLALGQTVADRILCVEEHNVLLLDENAITEELAHRHHHTEGDAHVV